MLTELLGLLSFSLHISPVLPHSVRYLTPTVVSTKSDTLLRLPTPLQSVPVHSNLLRKPSTIPIPCKSPHMFTLSSTDHSTEIAEKSSRDYFSFLIPHPFITRYLQQDARHSSIPTPSRKLRPPSHHTIILLHQELQLQLNPILQSDGQVPLREAEGESLELGHVLRKFESPVIRPDQGGGLCC